MCTKLYEKLMENIYNLPNNFYFLFNQKNEKKRNNERQKEKGKKIK